MSKALKEIEDLLSGFPREKIIKEIARRYRLSGMIPTKLFNEEALIEARKLVASGDWEEDRFFPSGLPKPKCLVFLFGITDLVSCLAQHHRVNYWDYRQKLCDAAITRIESQP